MNEDNLFAFLLLTAVAFGFELLSFLIERYLLNPVATTKEGLLAAEAIKIRQESKKFEAPDTFVQFAKMGREANALEMQSEALRVEREDRKKTKAGKAGQFVTSYLLFPLALIVAHWVVWTSIEGVLQMPTPQWIWPLAHALALPNQPPNGSISGCGWMIVCRRVFARRVFSWF